MLGGFSVGKSWFVYMYASRSKKKKKKKSFLSHLDLALCQFGLLSDIFVRGCSSPSALAVAQSLLVTHCLKET